MTGSLLARSPAYSPAAGPARAVTDHPFAGGTQLPLDSITGGMTAYGLRLLRTAYSGSSIRVRRSSDNSEQDIGFVSGLLDESSLTTFVGANDGFVTKFYDQVGSTDAVQSTAANQAKIVSSGTVVAARGRPTPDYDGTNDFYTVAAGAWPDHDGAIVAVFELTTTAQGSNADIRSVFDRHWYDGTLYEVKWTVEDNDHSEVALRTSGATRMTSTVNVLNTRICGAIVGGGTARELFENGVSKDTDTVTNAAEDTTPGFLGCTPNAQNSSTNVTRFWAGYQWEVYFFSSLSAADRQSLETNVSSYLS